MIVLVWSFVSSLIQYSRQRTLTAAIEAFFGDPTNKNMILLCRRISNIAQKSVNVASTSNGGGHSLEVPQKLIKYSSEPCLNQSSSNPRAIYSNELSEVVTQPSVGLQSSEWRFCPSIPGSEEDLSAIRVHFIATSRRESAENERHARNEEEGPPVVTLNSSCERIAFHRLHPSNGIFACSLHQFCEIVYAWSEGVLLETTYSPPIQSIQTVSLDVSNNAVLSSSNALSPTRHSASLVSLLSQQRALPLLEQLFWGDQNSLNNIRQRFMSEGALNNEFSFTTLPRRCLAFSPRRRHRSSIAPSSFRYRTPSPLAIEYRGRVNGGPLSPPILCTLTSSFDSRSLPSSYRNQTAALPPYIRQLEREAREREKSRRATTTADVCIQAELPSRTTERESRKKEETADSERDRSSSPPSTGISSSIISAHSSNTHSLTSVSPSITVDDFEEHSLAEGRIEEEDELPFIDSSSTATIMWTPNGNSMTSLTKPSKLTSGSTTARSMGSDTTSTSGTLRTSKLTSGTSTSRSMCSDSYDRETTTPLNTPRAEIPTSGRRGRNKSPLLEMFRKISLTVDCDAAKCIDPQLQRLTTFELLQRRRHSYIPSTSDEEYNGGRRRSLSPSPMADNNESTVGGGTIMGYNSGDIFKGSSIFGGLRDSFRKQVFSPVRRLSSSRERRKERPMQKPPTILVYTNGQQDLYNRIRDYLSTVIPSDLYTVFHISPDVIKKQHWVETASVCLLLLDTNGLEDAGWAKLNSYFSNSGKIIFVCQNNLLSSLTSTDSSKKQADLLKIAFGGKSASLGKDFESFLKKSLKTLKKHNEIHETFHSKDLVGGFKYSVVLSKKNDNPLLLYMENSVHQASAVFSDATSEQLMAAGSRIVRDALSRVGIQVIPDNSVSPTLSQGYMQAKEDAMIDKITSLRYGEYIGHSPQLFIRKTEKIKEDKMPTATDEVLPIEVQTRSSSLPSFDSSLYFRSLKTNRIGHLLVYLPITTSTMDVCTSVIDSVPGVPGVCVVARQQTKGKGRGGNEYISPPGAALFTFSSILPRKSRLGSHPSFTQHVVAVSVVEAIWELSRTQDFPLRIKWPNDFYFNRSHKVGGMIASAKFRDDCIEIIVGIGINVSNSRPTVCLNDMLPEGSSHSFTVEEVIARTLTKFEENLALYELRGQEVFLKKYYGCWLHDREEVLLESEGEKVVICGLDENGYLVGRSKRNTRKLFSVADNGNTFDMMKGLIRMKST